MKPSRETLSKLLLQAGLTVHTEDHAYLDAMASFYELAVASAGQSEPVATMWQHDETGRTRIITPDSITDCDARWHKVGDLYLHPTPSPAARVPMTDEQWQAIADITQSIITRDMKEQISEVLGITTKEQQ